MPHEALVLSDRPRAFPGVACQLGSHHYEWLARVRVCLLDAGWTLIRIRTKDYSLRLKTSSLETLIETDDIQSCAEDVPAYIPPPTAREIDHMDFVLGWLNLIENITLRRIVAYRMMYDYDRDRHVYTLRRIAKKLGCSHQVISDWHDKAVRALADCLVKEKSAKDKILLYRTRQIGANVA